MAPLRLKPVITAVLRLAIVAVLLMNGVAFAQPSLSQSPNASSTEDANRGTPRVVRRAVSAPETAPKPSLPREHHPWARFQPGAWRQLAITTESFDANGRFLGRSVTSQTETLKDVGDATFALEVVSLIEIGGKRLRGEAQTVVYNLLCDEACDTVTASRLDTANIALDGAVIPVERWSVQRGGAELPQTEVLYYSRDRSPYLLRRERQSDAAGVLSTRSVTRVDAPLLLDGGIVPSSHVTLVTHDGANQTNRFEVLCDAVPGGLVSASSTERDASGRRVRWSTTELEGYGESPQPILRRRRLGPLRRRHQRDL